MDLGLLASAVARPQATFDSEDLYPNLFMKAAALMESLILNHPFVDGNKRVGVTAAGLFLRQNGWQLQSSNADLESFTFKVATTPPSTEGIAEWLREHSVPVDH